MNIKQTAVKVAGGIATAMIIAGPFFASAVSVEDLQNQLKSLLGQIAQLQGQSQTSVSVSSDVAESRLAKPGYRICSLVARNLSQGSRGDDVTSLQEFLRGEGYLSANATGFFGALTAQAVAKWQAKEGVSAIGVFGPLSRERLKMWCGNSGSIEIPGQRFSATPTRGDAPLTVSFNTWLSGFRINTISYAIDYGDGTSERAADCPAPADACTGPGVNTHTYTQNGTYVATLNKITDPCAGQVACRAAIHQEAVGKVQVQVGPIACTKEYKPVCGAKTIYCITTPCNPVPTTYGNSCMMRADGAAYLYDGQCRDTYANPADDPMCKSWNDGCNICSRQNPGSNQIACTLRYCPAENTGKAYCTGYFDNGNNKPPVISGISGPTTLVVGATGTWTVNATDPENGQLSYKISWGDEGVGGWTNMMGLPAADFVQTSTFTHVYANAGTYTVNVAVTDSAGNLAKTSITVKVGNDAVACTMEYNPVCGRPAGCANTCAQGQVCAAICQLHQPRTYGNRCSMNAAGATFMHAGECTGNEGYLQ